MFLDFDPGFAGKNMLPMKFPALQYVYIMYIQ